MMKAEALAHLAKGSRPSAARRELVQQALTLAEEAFKADKLSAANDLAKLALTEAGKVRDRELVGRCRATSKEIQEALKASFATEQARAQLKAHPGDTAAHSALGRYFCLVKGDWEAGLPHFAQGSDADLRALAEDDLKHTPPVWKPAAGVASPSPVQAAAAMKVADAWWNLAETARGRERECMLFRAGYWDEEVAAGPNAGEHFAKIRRRREILARLGIIVPPKILVTNSIGIKFVLIPPGEFDMGSTAQEISSALEDAQHQNAVQDILEQIATESPRHRVKITNAFYFGIYEVTQEQYREVTGMNVGAAPAAKGTVLHSIAGKDEASYPAQAISWLQAMEFCRRLSRLPSEQAAERTYRLPTEAEWEYACRAGTTTPWHSGDDQASLKEYAWVAPDAKGKTHPVGQKKPNAWGLYDMHGNLWEWCSDWFGPDYYRHSPATDPPGEMTGTDRVSRGGSFSTFPPALTLRWRDKPESSGQGNGFRVVCKVH